jgi:hypothetical protein
MVWSRSDGLSANEHALVFAECLSFISKRLRQASRANKAINQIDHDLP